MDTKFYVGIANGEKNLLGRGVGITLFHSEPSNTLDRNLGYCYPVSNIVFIADTLDDCYLVFVLVNQNPY